MVYSNALYFASHCDKLTKEIYSTFDERQKSQKNANPDKITLARSLLALHGKGHAEEIG